VKTGGAEQYTRSNSSGATTRPARAGSSASMSKSATLISTGSSNAACSTAWSGVTAKR
jgi:hypothetical protein